MSGSSELACVYAALVLHDDGVPVTEEKLSTLIKAAGVTVEPYWPSLFAKLLEKTNMDDIISAIGSGPAPGAAAAAPGGGVGGGAPAEAKEEEKKEESEEEEEEDMGFDLFD